MARSKEEFKTLFATEFDFTNPEYGDPALDLAWTKAGATAAKAMQTDIAFYSLVAHFLFIQRHPKEDVARGLLVDVGTVGGQSENFKLPNSWSSSQYENQLAQTKFGRDYLLFLKKGTRLRMPGITDVGRTEAYRAVRFPT